MAAPATAAGLPDRQPAPANLNLNVNSKNPFRNRMSTASPSPRSPDPTQQQFPFPAQNTMSKNPFLDPVDNPSPGKAVTTNGDGVALADDIFKDLSLLDKPASNNGARGPPPPRPSNLPPGRPTGPPGERRDGPPRGPPRGPGSPPKRPEHRRRASDTSVMEVDRERERQRRKERERAARPSRTESEERRHQARKKEREERYKREGRDPKSGRRKPQRNLDLIDKLDVTGIYGEGLFHHDGPFDACNPHRNAKRSHRAPMQAFPEGSANMALGGSGPLNSRLDLDKFHGRGEEGFADYGNTRKADTTQQYMNTTDRMPQVHGAESYGLGTSTFLEGAPASRRALERRESEDQTMQDGMGGGGLQRKKSLAQRLRGMSAGQRRGAPGEIRSPEARYYDGPVSPPLIQSLSAGGRDRANANYTKDNEYNPFDKEYDAAFEKKGTQIKIVETEKPSAAGASSGGHRRMPSSPRGISGAEAGLTRSVTAEAAMASPTEEKPMGGGFLNRMKSLKGGKRARPERKDSNQ